MPHYDTELNIGIAVATDRGLVAPTLARVEELGLEEISEQLRGLISRARNHKLKVQDLTPATFTISNIGMFDVTSALAIIVPPQLAILCTGRVTEKVVAHDGVVAVRPMMVASVSADHRGVDGSVACEFLAGFARALQA